MFIWICFFSLFSFTLSVCIAPTQPLAIRHSNIYVYICSNLVSVDTVLFGKISALCIYSCLEYWFNAPNNANVQTEMHVLTNKKQKQNKIYTKPKCMSKTLNIVRLRLLCAHSAYMWTRRDNKLQIHYKSRLPFFRWEMREKRRKKDEMTMLASTATNLVVSSGKCSVMNIFVFFLF